jgi:hypothetical protein
VSDIAVTLTAILGSRHGGSNIESTYHKRAIMMFARAASCDVTPRDRPVRLSGYYNRTDPVSTVLDSIEVSGILLECAGQRCLIFSFDLMTVGAELQNLITTKLTKYGFEPREIVLFASHTHFAPATDQACSRLGTPDEQFVGDVANSVESLVQQMLREDASEVRLEVLRGHLRHSINRRRFWPFPTFGRTYGFRFSSVSMAPNPQGPVDELATVLLLRKVNGERILGVIWHYTCHPTAVTPDNVISPDYPGTVRQALREQFGNIPCVFAQGFCGDIRPNIRSSRRQVGLRERVRRVARTVISGPSFRAVDAEDWKRWSASLAGHVLNISRNEPHNVISPTNLGTGVSHIPVSDFFSGSAPDKPLAVHVIRFGDDLELVALSAEMTVDWKGVIERAIPTKGNQIRLYVGYLGALFGYMPTASQITEGGYEVEGFQTLFGLSGKFKADRIEITVTDGVKRAFKNSSAPISS